MSGPLELDLGGRCRFAKLVAKRRRKPAPRRRPSKPSKRQKRVESNKAEWLRRGLGLMPIDELVRATGLARQTVHQAARRYGVQSPPKVLGKRWVKWKEQWGALTAKELAEREQAAQATVYKAATAYGLGRTKPALGPHVWTVDELDSPERCKALAVGVVELRLPVAAVAKALRVSPFRLTRWVRLGLGGTMECVPPKAPSQAVCRLLAAMLEVKRQQIVDTLEALRGEVIGSPRPPPKLRALPRV